MNMRFQEMCKQFLVKQLLAKLLLACGRVLCFVCKISAGLRGSACEAIQAPRGQPGGLDSSVRPADVLTRVSAFKNLITWMFLSPFC